MSRRGTTRRRFLKYGSSALVAGLAGCIGQSSPSEDAADRHNVSSNDTQSKPDGGAYSAVYRDVISSVVSVRTGGGQGTGFLYDEAHVVTNAHVAGGARSARLRFDDGSWASGEVRGTDVHSDLAVIEVDSTPESATPLSLAEERPVVGQEVIAIGNPYDLDGTLTTGVVSGTDRLIPSPSGYRIPDAIQTDAAVNPGNSGGPLTSTDGAVVGVVNSKRGDDIAFGISAALTRRVVPSLIERGAYEHAYMGVSFETVTPTLAEANGLEQSRGLIAVETVANGPADGVLRQSELRYADGRRLPVGGDVLLAVEGTEIRSFEDLASYLALRTRPGETVRLTVLRNGAERTVEMTLGTRPERSQSPLR